MYNYIPLIRDLSPRYLNHHRDLFTKSPSPFTKTKKTTSNRLSSKQPEKMASEITSKPFTNVLSVTHFSLIAQICFSHLSFITRWFLSSSQCFREKKKPELTKIPRSKVLLISDILYIENIW